MYLYLDKMHEAGMLLYLVFFVFGITNADRICSQCFHIKFSSSDKNLKLPNDIINEACLSNGDSFTHNEVVVCESGVSLCKKVVGKAELVHKGSVMQASIFARECGPETKVASDECIEDTKYLPKVLKSKGVDEFTVNAKACYCDTNYCNSAQKITLNVILMSIGTFIVAVIL